MRESLGRLLRSRFFAPVLTAALVWAATAALVAGTAPEQSAHATVALVPREGRPLPTAAMIQLLSTRYVASGSSSDTARSVAATVGLDASDVEDMVEITIPPDTTNLQVAVVTDKRRTAVEVAEAYALQIVDDSATDPDLTATVVVPAHSTGPVRGQQRRLLMIGLAAGLLLGAVALGLLSVLRTRQPA